MVELTSGSTRDCGHGGRPTPTGLVHGTTNDRLVESDNFGTAIGKGADFVWRRKGLVLKSRHPETLGVRQWRSGADGLDGIEHRLAGNGGIALIFDEDGSINNAQRCERQNPKHRIHKPYTSSAPQILARLNEHPDNECQQDRGPHPPEKDHGVSAGR